MPRTRWPWASPMAKPRKPAHRHSRARYEWALAQLKAGTTLDQVRIGLCQEGHGFKPLRPAKDGGPGRGAKTYDLGE